MTRKLYEWLLSLLLGFSAVWFGACVLLQGGMFAVEIFGAPRHLPLPFVGIADFVEGANGDVYILLGVRRTLRYDHEGRFVASYRTEDQFHSDAQLAADALGRIHVKTGNRVTVYTEDWERLPDLGYQRDFSWSSRGYFVQSWRLTPTGRAVHAPQMRLTVRDRLVLPGEALFSEDRRGEQRGRFKARDGTVLERRGRDLVRCDAAGNVIVRYRSEQWYRPFLLPWPGLVPLVVLIALAWLRARGTSLSRTRGAEVDSRPAQFSGC